MLTYFDCSFRLKSKMKPPSLSSAKTAVLTIDSSSQLRSNVSPATFTCLFYICIELYDLFNREQKAVYADNHVKSFRLSVEASLRELRTKYIDSPYVHWWAFETSVEGHHKSSFKIMIKYCRSKVLSCKFLLSST